MPTSSLSSSSIPSNGDPSNPPHFTKGLKTMNTINIQMPEKIQVEEPSHTGSFGRFIIQPLEKGYGVTIGNSLRRVLLTSLPGYAITGFSVDGVLHEFTSIPGVVEDVPEFVLNLK